MAECIPKFSGLQLKHNKDPEGRRSGTGSGLQRVLASARSCPDLWEEETSMAVKGSVQGCRKQKHQRH